MSSPFNQRVFGCVIIKSVNSNYNADFSHQPRTLPDGTVYATDKALKYTVRRYLARKYTSDKLFYFRSLNEKMQPRTLDETYQFLFGDFPKEKDEVLRKKIAKDLLSCLDVRLFGGTFAGKTNISLHGPVQISHGMNRFEGNSSTYSEQIMSPFRNPGTKNVDSTMTTLGTQAKLREGHYVHHFSINPHNIKELAQISEGMPLQQTDVLKLKEGLCSGASLYDSAAKAGTENELLLWVQLKPDSLLVLPSFVEKVAVGADGTIDLSTVTEILERPKVKVHIDRVEIHRDPSTAIKGAPKEMELLDLYQ